jgi:DNA polymerase III gamma/tau subunit
MFSRNMLAQTDLYSILVTMEWTRRELQSIQGPQIGMIDTVIGNIHGGLSKVGLLERNGSPTTVGRIVTDVLGHTRQQRSKDTLQRTFDHLLSTLEENIANELARADNLFQIFESVDRQFQTLHRSVAKEEDSLANKKDEFLASLWRQNIKNKMKIIKYEKNLKLLKDVRSSTLSNKFELKSHIQIIRNVKDQLDKTRRNLISPLIRRAQSNSFGIEQQLQDLSGTYGLLKSVRDVQKKKVMQQLYGGSGKRTTFIRGGDGEDEIEEGSD